MISEDDQKTFEEMSPLELLEATQPQLMDLDQFKAEAHFQLASLAFAAGR
jgi:hypothetical protein